MIVRLARVRCSEACRRSPKGDRCRMNDGMAVNADPDPSPFVRCFSPPYYDGCMCWLEPEPETTLRALVEDIMDRKEARSS